MDKFKCWRHRRVWIKPASIASIRGLSEIPLVERSFVENWVMSGRPLVGRAVNPCDHGNENLLPLGLMLHLPEAPKKRLNLQVDSTAVLKIDEPLSIQVVMSTFPSSMVEKVKSMLSRLADYPIQIQVFGSVFWSYEGGESYMTENSDIDLLISPAQNCDLSKLAKELCSLSEEIDLRLDGEFEFLNAYSVSWKEFASNATELLIKTDLGPKMMSRYQVIEEFNAPQ
jgi:phosphoribosyl-dephospho-CoA transferase